MSEKLSKIVSACLLVSLSGAASVTAARADELRNCAPLAERLGRENVWFGHVCGSRQTSPARMWADMGCFASEGECRRWLLATHPDGRSTSALSCRRGAPRWSVGSPYPPSAS